MKFLQPLVLVIAVGLLGCGAKQSSGPAANASAPAGNVDAVADNMNTIAVSMSLMDRLPPAAICDKASKPLLSWRVAILPKLGQEALYKEFKLDEPWDGPNNKKLIERMPAVYASPGVAAKEPGMTYFQVFVGPRTIWEDQASKTDRSASSLPRGSLETILVAEASDPVPWTKPQDLQYDPQKPLPALGKVLPDRFLVVMAEGSVFSSTERCRREHSEMRSPPALRKGSSTRNSWSTIPAT